jgi:hypothetical protein
VVAAATRKVAGPAPTAGRMRRSRGGGGGDNDDGCWSRDRTSEERWTELGSDGKAYQRCHCRLHEDAPAEGWASEGKRSSMGGGGGNKEGCRPRAHARKKKESMGGGGGNDKGCSPRAKGGEGAWAAATVRRKVAGPAPSQERRRRNMGGGGGIDEGCRPRARTGEEEEGAWAAAATRKVAGPAPTPGRRRRSIGGGDRGLGVGREE